MIAGVKIDWDKLKCQETHGIAWSTNTYLTCDLPAVAFVLHYKDQKAYPMCKEHADHNLHNRGGVCLIVRQDKLGDDHVHFLKNYGGFLV